MTTCSIEYNSSTVETNPWTYLHRTDKLSLWVRGPSLVIAINKEIKCKGKKCHCQDSCPGNRQNVVLSSDLAKFDKFYLVRQKFY